MEVVQSNVVQMCVDLVVTSAMNHEVRAASCAYEGCGVRVARAWRRSSSLCLDLRDLEADSRVRFLRLLVV